MKIHQLIISTALCTLSLMACKEGGKKTEELVAEGAADSTKSYYHKVKSEVEGEDESEFEGGEVDNGAYNPASPEASVPLIDQGRTYTLDSNIEISFDARTAEELEGKSPVDTLRIGSETFRRDLHNITENDLYNLRHNLEYLKDTKENPTADGSCRGKNCPVYAHVNKKEQRLYLYVNGEPVDTFKTSTARSGYKTPDFDRKPDGRIYTKYSSHKYHGGNWNGLGNMPYAVFIEGGYAIHGATSGEIHQLGSPASHGCIRIHPKNAKVFNKLVKFAGVENTWVHITEE